ncbi:hypothetical protein L3X07_01970 [Levilactobacillus brevis]|nr:hypothetical protein [Levilactobacillus brevis]
MKMKISCEMVTSSASDRVRNALKILGRKLGNQLAGDRWFVPYAITLIELAKMAGTTRKRPVRSFSV